MYLFLLKEHVLIQFMAIEEFKEIIKLINENDDIL